MRLLIALFALRALAMEVAKRITTARDSRITVTIVELMRKSVFRSGCRGRDCPVMPGQFANGFWRWRAKLIKGAVKKQSEISRVLTGKRQPRKSQSGQPRIHHRCTQAKPMHPLQSTLRPRRCQENRRSSGTEANWRSIPSHRTTRGYPPSTCTGD